MTRTERDLLLLHATFAAVAAVVLLMLPGALGWRVAGLIVAYDLAVIALALRRRDRQLLRLWWFAAVLSIWQVLPDAFLADGLGVLVFPPDGFPDIGPVTATMAGLWTVAIVVIVGSAVAVEERRGGAAGTVTAAVVALVVFVAAEALLTQLPIWQARNVARLGEVALYIVPAEVLLGVVAHDVFLATRDRHALIALPATLIVTLVYTGAAAVSWLLFEGSGLF